MELIRGRSYKKWINCFEDKRDYDFMCHGFMNSRERLAIDYCEKYHVPDIADNEKEEIVNYWKQYGILIKDFCWHRMYYHATGIHDPRFIPDLIAGLVIYEFYNDHTFEETWRDKNMFDRLLPDVPLPETYLKRINSRFRTNLIDEKDSNDYEFIAKLIYEKMNGENEVIIKNTRSTGFGRGVKKYYITAASDIVAALEEWDNCSDYIIQKFIKQHTVLASLNESSSNMIRICSWRHGNQVDIMFATVRAGVPGAVTDVSFVNGEELVQIVKVTKDGFLGNRIYNQDGIIMKELPPNIPLPSWNRMVDIVKQNHLMIDRFDIVGWDFTIDEQENPICFEWNVQWPGTVLYQFVNGPLYGEKTEEVLQFLKDEKNRDNFIPCYMREK